MNNILFSLIIETLTNIFDKYEQRKTKQKIELKLSSATTTHFSHERGSSRS